MNEIFFAINVMCHKYIAEEYKIELKDKRK